VEEENTQEETKQDTTKMWQSVVTCIPIQIQPISKRSQHAIEDLQALQQEQSMQDPTGYNRQVLPNIRPIPKSKFLYKGLAYKQVKKLPGIFNENTDEDNTTTSEKPLAAYNLTQAYIRYEMDAARTKQTARQPSSTAPIMKDQTSLDLREMRKRIVKGTTLPYRPVPQSATWTPGRADHRSTLGSEVLVPIRSLSTLTNALSPSPFPFTSQLQQYFPVHTTPILSQDFNLSSIDNDTNVSSL
jgi:hypothetical protein